MLIAAIKDFLHAIKKSNLTGFFPAPILLQELEDLATLHNIALPSVTPALVSPEIGTEIRVPSLENSYVQEPRVVLPNLSTANPTHTAPADPLSIAALIPSPYPPPPGLPPLPVTDHPNALLDVPLSAPIVPVAPIRRSPRVHVVCTPSSFVYSTVTVPAPYSDIVHGDNETISAANLTASEVADLLSAAAAAIFRTKDHFVRVADASASECPASQLSYSTDHISHANAVAPSHST